ncbi:L,D-transpeptidase family protein [Ancylobacter pratisalsi]|uniref:L,D-transpeptidase family protein n=2 Tax=Ancylobacter pratisalsi TaxID=1745854 RepID=A0A6P1YSB8_9HYPH|nr:L,D-transpeptidase [Ancylobacter pratisalsi]QIB36032.1 L,D-transpeptidase family protein [Ancylobacter pratisalsi]
MMVVRPGLVSAVALTVLSSVSVASAQYYPTEQAQPGYDASGAAAPPENVQVPAAIDPYGAAATGQPAQQGYAEPSYGQSPTTVANAPVANAPYSNPASQPAGYPPGAYSGQPPAGMLSPYGSTLSVRTDAPAQATYVPPATTGSVPRADLNNSYGTNGSSVAMLPPEDQPEEGPAKELPAYLKRQVVDYVTTQPPGTIVIDTPNTFLYYVLPGGKAERYGIGVGREGFTWSGTEKVSRKAEWADWRPPAEMIERQPYLPRFMAGGPGNPLGARTMYLGSTVYRIHGTNQPSTIGQFMSSGCIRMLNEDVEDLYDRVKVGTKVVVMPGNPPEKPAEEAEATPASTTVSAAPGFAVQ